MAEHCDMIFCVLTKGHDGRHSTQTSPTYSELQVRIRDLEQALHRYSEHRVTCTYEYQQCDCGLDAILATIQDPSKAVNNG